MIQIAEFCRICIRSNISLKNINNEDKDGVKLISKLKTCVPEIIQKRTEDFNYICIECWAELKRSYTFVKKCEKSENLLLGYIEKLTQVSEPNLIDIKKEPLELSSDIDDLEKPSTSNSDLDKVPLTQEANITPIKVNSPCMERKILILKMQRRINESRRNKRRFTHSVKVKEKPHACNICNKKFTTKYYLHCHKLVHAGKNPHKCTICDRMFTLKCQLNQHILIHTGEKNFKCNICDQKFFRKSILSTHMFTHSEKEYKCNICYMEFTLKATLDKHMFVHSGNKIYKCSICCETFCQKFILDEHFRIHLKQNSHVCSVCGKQFKQKYLVDLHMVVHSSERPYECCKCDKTFNRKFTLERHIMTMHDSVRAYKCKHCVRRFRDQYTLNIHMLTHNTDKRPSVVIT